MRLKRLIALMPIRYYTANDVKKLADEVVNRLGMDYVKTSQVMCVRSRGSKAKRTIARIHGLGRVWQLCLQIPAHYVIEVIAEQYDELSRAEKEKTIIHELLHIPGGFKGGFRHHKGWISDRKIERLHTQFQQRRAQLLSRQPP